MSTKELTLFVGNEGQPTKHQCFVCGHIFENGEKVLELTKFNEYVGTVCDNEKCLPHYRQWFDQRWQELFGGEI